MIPTSFLLRTPLWLLTGVAAVSVAHAAGSGDPSTLQTVVVSATRSERAVEESTVPISVVSRSEIERTRARTLKQALENVPGLQLREVHGKSGFELSLQGLSGDQVLVLIDGLPITASTGSTVDLGQYLVGEVERVEVVKGASSAQYGSSAMGGVVNVITRRIQPGFGATLEVDAGSYGRQNDSGRRASANQKHARFGLSGGGEAWRLALSGDVLDDAGFGLRPELWTRQGDASRRVQLTGRAEWLPRAGQRFWLEAGRYSEDDVQRYEYFVPSKYVPQRKSEDIARDRVVLGSQWRLDGGARLQAKAVREHYDSESREVSDGYQIARRNSAQQTQHLSTQVELPAWGRQVWMLGADWHRETLRQTTNGNSELQFNGRAQRDSRELFLQNDIFLNDDWELLLGVRGQHDSDFGGHAVPKVSLRGTLLERGDAGLVVREGLDICRVLHEVLDGLDAGRVRLGDELEAGEVLGAGDLLGILGAHLDGGDGKVVRAGEVDDLEAFGGDRVGRDHAVHGAVLDQGLAGLDGGVDVLDLLLPALAEDVLGQQLGDTGVEAGGLPTGDAGQGEHLVRDSTAAHQLTLVLDGGRPGARGDRVICGDRAGSDHVGGAAAFATAVGGAGAAIAATAEVGTRAGVGGAGCEADQRQGRSGGDDGAATGSEAGGRHGSLRFLEPLQRERRCQLRQVPEVRCRGGPGGWSVVTRLRGRWAEDRGRWAAGQWARILDRNAFARSLRGAVKNSSGSPCSTISPWSM